MEHRPVTRLEGECPGAEGGAECIAIEGLHVRELWVAVRGARLEPIELSVVRPSHSLLHAERCPCPRDAKPAAQVAATRELAEGRLPTVSAYEELFAQPLEQLHDVVSVEPSARRGATDVRKVVRLERLDRGEDPA